MIMINCTDSINIVNHTDTVDMINVIDEIKYVLYDNVDISSYYFALTIWNGLNWINLNWLEKE